jgi:hypothetical protein
MDRVLVMCASRGRPDRLNRMIESVRRTSTKADVAIYLDDDNHHLYGDHKADFCVVGERVGQCRSLNALCEKFHDYSAFGAATDDCVFETVGWDDWVIETTNSFKGKVGAIAPRCEVVDRMDFPWLTRRWVDVARGFVPYACEHFYWDVGLEWVGEMTQIAFAKKSEFHISHEGIMPEPEKPSDTPSDYQLRIIRSHTDARTTLNWLALHRRGLVADLNAAIREG